MRYAQRIKSALVQSLPLQAEVLVRFNEMILSKTIVSSNCLFEKGVFSFWAFILVSFAVLLLWEKLLSGFYDQLKKISNKNINSTDNKSLGRYWVNLSNLNKFETAQQVWVRTALSHSYGVSELLRSLKLFYWIIKPWLGAVHRHFSLDSTEPGEWLMSSFLCAAGIQHCIHTHVHNLPVACGLPCRNDGLNTAQAFPKLHAFDELG